MFFFKTDENEVKVIKTISKYGYTLDENETALYKEEFEKLDKVLSAKDVNYEDYAKEISKLFIIDFYTLSNKLSKNDIGGTQFIKEDMRDNFIDQARSTFYKYVEVKSDKRTQKLPEVSLIDDVKVENTTFVIKDTKTTTTTTKRRSYKKTATTTVSGTKVPVLAFILVIGINVLYYIITLIRKKENKKLSIILLPIILVLVLSTFIFPKTHFYKNLVIHINYLEKKDNGKITTWHIIDHFIFSERLSFEEKTRKAYNKSSILEKAFGIGYIENYSTDKVRLKTIEMDYFDVFYRHGIFGFIIFFYPLIYVLKGILSNKYKLNKKTLNIGLSIILIFILALFQGHIFVNPANSIYVALILALTFNKTLDIKYKSQD